jgi:hypothetical protein
MNDTTVVGTGLYNWNTVLYEGTGAITLSEATEAVTLSEATGASSLSEATESISLSEAIGDITLSEPSGATESTNYNTQSYEEMNTNLFSPADFGDADDLRPTAAVFDITGNGGQAPYTTAINGLIQKQIDEIKQKSAVGVSIPTGWKSRLRAFLSQKNTELLDFLSLSIQSHPTLGKGELILRKFGTVPFNPNAQSVRDLVLDSSGADTIGEINNALTALRNKDGLNDYITSVRYIFDQYREAGEEALRYEALLKMKLHVLDMAQGKLSGIVDLEPTEAYPPLLEVTENYIGVLFKKNEIDEVYKGFIAAYRKFITLRDIVMMTRTVQSNENEPLCTICLNEQVVYTLSPCGHTYCQNCIKKQTGNCFVCRGPVKDKIRLYFG